MMWCESRIHKLSTLYNNVYCYTSYCCTVSLPSPPLLKKKLYLQFLLLHMDIKKHIELAAVGMPQKSSLVVSM